LNIYKTKGAQTAPLMRRHPIWGAAHPIRAKTPP
jgi:hypothetical protein